MAIDFENDDILIIARYLSEQGFYYSPQWEAAADEIERVRDHAEAMATQARKLHRIEIIVQAEEGTQSERYERIKALVMEQE